mmetsp:Transcript_17638/g.38481  ORF Transcript_17638/g.38481 Transcript_17638/m.38481 type:complete len:111 (-) Transcript_17638:439-771(-)|eukprot:CAMPEP_0118932446 /NCGR_PEP_ID=MMETSP1169-20130426/10254_1 /TAXON_ID=36882 /ORGANISM="Pyramimonas obovata, Strain CCMP722" /LENGTH=110 /DNA_ID=CAMNT_0006875107 /DNA_START=35 /DNA_END=367 /DNA_ORIENTATION=-
MAARQLKIKVGTLTRTKKEMVMYEKEYEKEQEKVKKMMADGADAADLKQQEGVAAEAGMMVPDTSRRLEKALQDLQGLLAENDDEIKDTDEFKAAQELVAEVDGMFATRS